MADSACSITSWYVTWTKENKTIIILYYGTDNDAKSLMNLSTEKYMLSALGIFFFKLNSYFSEVCMIQPIIFWNNISWAYQVLGPPWGSMVVSVAKLLHISGAYQVLGSSWRRILWLNSFTSQRLTKSKDPPEGVWLCFKSLTLFSA